MGKDSQPDSVNCRHTENLDASICRLLWIKIIDELASRLPAREQRDPINRQSDRLIPGRQDEAIYVLKCARSNHGVYTW
jgi:hypothetical protein